MIAESTISHTLFRKTITIGLLLFLILAGIFFAFLKKGEKQYEGKIYPGVTINGAAVGTLTPGQVRQQYEKKNEELKEALVTVTYSKTPIATLSGTTLRIRYDSKGIADRAYLIGRSSRLTSRLLQKFLTLTGIRTYDFQVYPEYDEQYVKERLSAFEETYNREAKNALFKFEDGRVVRFRPEEKGLLLLSSSFLTDMKTAIASLHPPYKKTVALRSKVIEPEITLAEANGFGIEELIAEGKSDYTHSIPERVHNVLLAASKFNGILIPKGKTFSFNETIGDISALTGYKPAYIIKDGKTVLGDGGGVCQVSTTLFRTALHAGLPIDERFAHAYRVQYYENDSPPGLDATVFAPSVDLKFTNNTPSSILIETEADEENNLLTFRFYGKRDDRQVEMSKVAVYDIQSPPPPRYEDDFTLKKGVVRQVDFAAGGAKANFSYKVSLGEKILFEKTFYSSYRPWAAVYLVGQAD